ncbi:hypothetical protein FKP32DRAFT_1598639 [Trametes sanguinea]|nr:hypothetical protein FKP32DRAFT_1598639 [Trametes sanguinea]
MSRLYRLFPTDPHGHPLLDVEGKAGLAASDRDLLGDVPWPQLQSWARARIDDHLGYIHALKAIYNDGALIHCLPNELLMYIFVLGCSTRRDIRLSHVCRRWRSLALATPSLWANLVNQDSGAAIEQLTRVHRPHVKYMDIVVSIFARSGSCTLRPRFAYFSSAHAGILTMKRAQISTLHISSMNPAEVLAFYATVRTIGGLPNLTELNLGPCSTATPRYDSWRDEDLPSLRTLSVDGASLTAECMVSSIRTLTLRGRSPCAAKPFVDALRRCPCLEVLRILEEAMPRTTIPDTEGVVHLPELKKLHSTHVERSTWSFPQLLSHLDLPDTTVVSVSFRGGRHSDAISSFPTHLSCLRMHMVTEIELRRGHAVAEFRSNAAAILHFSVDHIVTLVIELRNGLISLEDLEYLLPSTPNVTGLHLHVDCLEDAQARQAPILWNAPQLHRLHIHDMDSPRTSDSIGQPFLRLLCARQGSHAGTVPYPALEELEIERPLPNSRLASMEHPDDTDTALVRVGIWHMEDIRRELDRWIIYLGFAISLRHNEPDGRRLSRIVVRWWDSEPDSKELWPQGDADHLAECLARYVSKSATVYLPRGTYATRHHESD